MPAPTRNWSRTKITEASLPTPIDGGRLVRPSSFPAFASCGTAREMDGYLHDRHRQAAPPPWMRPVDFSAAGSGGFRRRRVVGARIRCPRRRRIMPAAAVPRRIRSRPVHLPKWLLAGTRAATRCADASKCTPCGGTLAVNGKVLVSGAFECACGNGRKLSFGCMDVQMKMTGARCWRWRRRRPCPPLGETD